jgi:hypothetical protein
MDPGDPTCTSPTTVLASAETSAAELKEPPGRSPMPVMPLPTSQTKASGPEAE